MTPKRIGIAADHGGFELKEELAVMLHDNGYEVIDYGNTLLNQDDDYPDYIIPLAQAVASGELDRGIAVCGSGVGACVAANKVKGVRACLISDTFSARQGVEDDNMNLICLGGRVIGHSLARELVKTFLEAQFSCLERHLRRVSKVVGLETE
jgi:ribose 5-phosphate isomerase B